MTTLKSKVLAFSAAVSMTAIIGPAPALAADYSNAYARDMLILTNWFEGDFDNSEQLWFENFDAAKVPEAERAERLHTTHTRINLPEFGDFVFYVEEYTEDNPENIIRQRLVTFDVDTSENAMRMKQGFFKEPAAVLGAKNLSNVTATDVFFMEECDVFWTRKGSQFEGAMKAKQCVFGEGADRRYSVHDMILSDSEYWRTDSTYLVMGDTFHKGNLPGRPSKMRKARQFTCDVSFKPENKDGMSFMQVRENSERVSGLKIHNQGGKFVTTRQYDGQKFEYLMREKKYPFYSELPEFIYFSMRKLGDPYSIAYIVADIDSRRLGGQFGDYGFNCQRVGYNFDESVDSLDNP